MAMVFVARDRGDRWRVVVKRDGKAEHIHMGTGCNKALAEKFARRLNDLLAARAKGFPDAQDEQWLASLVDDRKLYARLVKLGIASERSPCPTLAAFVDGYIARQIAKPFTMINHKAARRELVDHFTAGRALASITPADARDFFTWMQSDRRPLGKLGANTARRVIGRAKQYFAHALEANMITANPFAKMKCRVGASTDDRRVFVPMATIEAVLEQIVDPEFRAAVILARWGGLRVPSELAGMKWGDVRFAEKRLIVRVPKLEHHEGKDIRILPLFPEIETALLALYQDNYGADAPVFRRHASASANLRTQFERYINAAGLQAWPKLWQNLRASRATEIADQFPAHVAESWLGHTKAIAERHYYQIQEEHYAKAVAGNCAPGRTPGGAPRCAPRQVAPSCAEQGKQRKRPVTTAPGATSRSKAQRSATPNRYPRWESNPYDLSVNGF